MATLDCRYFSTASQLLPAVSLPVPSVLPDSALDGVDADDLLQNQLDELQTLQARFARLGQMLLPYLGAANPARPRLTGSLLLAPTLVHFQRQMRAFALHCGHLAQRTQRQLDQARRGRRHMVRAGGTAS